MSRFQSIKDVWEYLDKIPMFSKTGVSAANFGLKNIQRFCSLLGNPHEQFKSIHVAGTNGKGTVTLLLEAIYKAEGYKTGAFISPHLIRYNERVRLNGEEVSDSKILEFFQQAEPHLAQVPLTYFELSTALAFWVFAEEKVDIAIVEVGLGGRLDSTNILTPDCSVITSIGLDHQAVLGETKPEIAREKAGIIKPEVPVVLGNIGGDEVQEILEIANSQGSDVVFSQDLNPQWSDGRVSLDDMEQPLQTHFVEPVNASNVAVAYSVIRTLSDDFPIEKNKVRQAIEGFPGVPGRFEKMHPDLYWYFSGAHNREAIQSLFEGLARFNDKEVVFILSLMKDKVTDELIEPFRQFNRLFFYQQDGDRAASIEEIRRFLSIKNIDESNFETILTDFKQEVVIFAGSFYFYPIVKRWLTHMN